MANTESSLQIIPYYAHPHVHTVIVDDTWYDETVATPSNPDDLPFSTVAVIGADSGIDNTFVRINDLKVKKAIFGNGNFKKYGQASIQADVLFNGKTNVWLCRVLPDNATYSNIVILAHFRKGKVLDELSQETGKVRLEIKFSVAYANKPYVVEGSKSDNDIEEFAKTLASRTTDPQTGYMTLPLCYVRMIGRGRYGNSYSISITRDSDAEKEYGMKMYLFNLINNTDVTRISNQFCGTFHQGSKNNMSTLISDVLDQYSTGSCPIYIHPFDENFDELYEFYRNDIVMANLKYIQTSGSNNTEDIEEVKTALNISEDAFDPLFGYVLNTRSNESIPYYRNYTTRESGEWIAPDLEIPNTADATRPMNISEWNNVSIGSRVLVVADPLNDGYRWLYTVVGIDEETGNILYDEGVEAEIDADQYDGINISQSVGHALDGGHDGDFQEITVNGETRPPSEAEMKLLLSKEYVKVFRGNKDRKILSPARVNLDFIFDANYNMTSDEILSVDMSSADIFSNSTVLTDKDAANISTLVAAGTSSLDYADLNVKKAMYDLNEFRNRNGMTVTMERGAGCSLYLDCNLAGLKNTGINFELINIINMFEEFDGRATSIDLGYYEIPDPYTNRKIKVTADYFIAKNLVPHIMQYGLNKPFTYKYAQMNSIQRDSTLLVKGNFIRDTFRPDIDLIDWDVKEVLYKSRINYWITSEEGKVVQRACQNTRQRDASALLEENNVRVLNTLKKGLEKACRGYLYEWNDPTVRKGYTDAQMDVYRPWIGTIVEDLEIKFDANEWEQERMIMHCYVVVKFKDIVKRIILEINIQRPNYSGGES